jgi:hypothetical protein
VAGWHTVAAGWHTGNYWDGGVYSAAAPPCAFW